LYLLSYTVNNIWPLVQAYYALVLQSFMDSHFSCTKAVETHK
jgi:hypothetical protein